MGPLKFTGLSLYTVMNGAFSFINPDWDEIFSTVILKLEKSSLIILLEIYIFKVP